MCLKYVALLFRNKVVDTSDPSKAKQAQAADALRRAKSTLSSLQQEANDDMPTGVASFQAAKAVGFSASVVVVPPIDRGS